MKCAVPARPAASTTAAVATGAGPWEQPFPVARGAAGGPAGSRIAPCRKTAAVRTPESGG
jgi:hypothetical protein